MDTDSHDESRVALNCILQNTHESEVAEGTGRIYERCLPQSMHQSINFRISLFGVQEEENNDKIRA